MVIGFSEKDTEIMAQKIIDQLIEQVSTYKYLIIVHLLLEGRDPINDQVTSIQLLVF